MVFTVLVNIVLCPFSHTSLALDTSLYVLVQDVINLKSVMGYEMSDRTETYVKAEILAV
jgi:hypothetical protein